MEIKNSIYKEYHFTFGSIEESKEFWDVLSLEPDLKNTHLVETKTYPLKYIGKKRYLYHKFPFSLLGNNDVKVVALEEDKIE